MKTIIKLKKMAKADNTLEIRSLYENCKEFKFARELLRLNLQRNINQ